jgi:putative membrane protein
MTSKLMLGVSLAAALMCSAPGAWAQGKMDKSAKPDKAAQTFMTKAIQGNLAEISMGQLAQQQAESPGVRSFGQQLVTDHTAANTRATAVASQMGMTPPSEPSKKHKSDQAKMAKMSGAAFDRAFVRHMVADHKMEIAEHRRAAKMKNDAVAAYATETLPVLEKHLEAAQALSQETGKGGGKSGAKGAKPSM